MIEPGAAFRFDPGDLVQPLYIDDVIADMSGIVLSVDRDFYSFSYRRPGVKGDRVEVLWTDSQGTYIGLEPAVSLKRLAAEAP